MVHGTDKSMLACTLLQALEGVCVGGGGGGGVVLLDRSKIP